MGHSDSKLADLQIPAEMASKAFPRRLTVTNKKSWTKIMALLSDPDSEGCAYVVTWPQAWYGSLIMHSGPTKDHAPLATAQPGGRMGQDFSIALPALPPHDPRAEILRYSATLKRETFWFAMQIGDGPDRRVEKFEWRHSRGSEVKGVEGGSGWGWKLVRMGNHPSSPGSQPAGEENGDDNRVDGFTSDGKEVVAVWADAGSLSLSKVGEFEYRGSGATGELGLLWSIMAAVSCMCIWQRRMQRNVTAGVVAGAA